MNTPIEGKGQAGATPMIWRLFLAVVLLVVLVGGIVGFNMFRGKMIAGYFASMQPPPVTVSTVEVEPVTWHPGLEAIGTAQSNSGVDLAVETAGSSRTSCSTPMTRSRPASTSCRSTT